MDMKGIREVKVVRDAEEVNQWLRKPDWVLLQIAIGVRKVHHAPQGNEMAYDFEAPYSTFVLGRQGAHGSHGPR